MACRGLPFPSDVNSIQGSNGSVRAAPHSSRTPSGSPRTGTTSGFHVRFDQAFLDLIEPMRSPMSSLFLVRAHPGLPLIRCCRCARYCRQKPYARPWTECSTPSTSMSSVFLPCWPCQKPGFQRSEEPERGPVDTAGRRDFRRLIMKSSTHHSNAPRNTSEAGSQ